MAKDDGGDYEIGYGKPPKEHRFKKGQSGNPKGRPKASKNMRSIVQKVADEPVEVALKGKRCSIPMREAVIRRVFADAVKGDHRAQRLVLGLINEHHPDERPHYVIEAPPEMSVEEWQHKYTPGYGLALPVNPTPGLSGSDDLDPPAPPNPQDWKGGNRSPDG